MNGLCTLNMTLLYLIVLGLLHKEGLSVLPELHVQTHRLPVDLNVHL